MNSILNVIFPDGYLIIMVMFFVAIMFGSAMGLMLQRTKTKGATAILILAAAIVSFVGYQATITITEADQPTAAQHAATTATEMVYVYGSDEPITRTEHEQVLAYSATHSPGDPE